MPWWFWVITHVWVACSTFLFVSLMNDEEFQDIKVWEWIFWAVMIIGGPITIFCAFCAFLFQEVLPRIHHDKVLNILEKAWHSRPMKIIRKMFKWLKDRRKRGKDLKEMDEKEDEWNIERTGIGSR